MRVLKKFTYISPKAKNLMQANELARQAFSEIKEAILKNCTDDSGKFTINSSEKNCNGVVPVKEGIYRYLEERCEWFREKPLAYFENAKKGGPIDVYKEFGDRNNPFSVGLEFETGNISSAHRSMNKLLLGIQHEDLQMAFLIMPIKKLAHYLTDRIANYEELAPYFLLLENFPFVVFGFDADNYDENKETTPPFPKGKDGMSQRNIRKWQNH